MHSTSPETGSPVRSKAPVDSSHAMHVDGKTVADAYLRRVAIAGSERIFLLKKGGAFQPVSWDETHARVVAASATLKKLGVGRGDRVCIMSNSSPEWFTADMAILGGGAVTVPIYHSSTLEDVGYILEHSAAKVLFVEDQATAKKIAPVFAGKKAIPIVCFSEVACVVPGLDITSWNEFTAIPADAKAEEEFRRSVAAVSADDIASIVYTSGTTGRPKGVRLRHRNFCAELRAVVGELQFRKDDCTLTFLPFAHIFGRVESYAPVFCGITLAFAENINAVAQNIAEVKPTILVSVPRIYEKIYAKIQSDIQAGSSLKRNLFQWATAVGREAARKRAAKEPLPLPLLVQFRLADKLVFSKVRAKLGGNLRFTVSGGAPLSRELAEFFHGCGICVLEGYGLTETSAAVCVNRPDDFAFGSVGRPLAGTQIRIEPDGEILLRGPVVFDGYYENAEATKEAVTDDGWFRTGDIGELDARGFLRITDRKKELIKTSGGKYVAPQRLENLLKQQRFVSNAMAYGDREKYITVLICLSEPDLKKWAQEAGVTATTVSELLADPKVLELGDAAVKAVNKELASFESIKKFRLVPDFTVESGELTPSLKVKRKVIVAKHEKSIRAMYS